MKQLDFFSLRHILVLKVREEDETETEIEEKEGKEKKTFDSGYELFLDYTEYSTIQGLIYIFFSYQVSDFFCCSFG